jgi:predicted RNase H-like HicB family nuclease
MKTTHRRVYTCWMLIEPAEDLDGLWVSHCLNFDVISQGDTPQEALASLREAVAMTVVDDLENGADPAERSAPTELWERLERVLRHGQAVKLSEVKPESRVILVLNDTFVATKENQHQAAEPMHIDDRITSASISCAA